MKGGFRQSMSWLHTWTGLLLGTLLYFIFLTGTAGYFDTEIDRWMRPELPMAADVSATRAVEVAVGHLTAQAPQADRWFIALPGERSTPYLSVSWRGGGAAGETLLDVGTGQPLTARETGGGELLYRMHWQLHYLPSLTSAIIVGVATMFMLVAIITGVIVHKKFFADFFTFRPGKGQRSWLDAHNVLGVMALPFHLMITYSGLIFFAATFMPLVISAHYGDGPQGQRIFFAELQGRENLPGRAGTPAPLTDLSSVVAMAETRWGRGQVLSLDILNPGDTATRVILRQQLTAGPLRSGESLTFDGVSGELLSTQPAIRFTAKAVHDVFLGLHEGLFADTTLRWLYFLSGLMGTGMIATGLILWTTKRRQKLERNRQAPHRGLLLVERLNVGTVLGLPIAIAAYFWANRLIPADLPGRAEWEVHAMFITWLAMLLHPIFRPVHRAWIEQAAIAAIACALLPILNMLTTDRHLGAMLPAKDWVMAGFDLTMLAFASAFITIVWRLRNREPSSPSSPAQR